MRYISNFKLYESQSPLKKFLNDNDILEDNSDYLRIKNMVGGNRGYLLWFLNMFFVNNITFNDLNDLFNKIKNDPNFIRHLSKPIIEYTKWEDLIDDIILTENKIKVRRILNSFPSLQKSFFNIDSKKDFELLLSFYNDKSKENLISKISRYKSKNDLTSAIKLLLSSDRSKGYIPIKNKIKECGAKLIVDSQEEDILICSVSFEQLRALGSDTSWCILNQSTFNSYNGGLNKQYIIFLTDLYGNESKIGVTYGMTFRTAHYINDSYVSENILASILENRGINIDVLTVSLDDVDFNNSSVTLLRSQGVSTKDILERKKRYNKEDLKLFSLDQIVELGLEDMLEIDNRNVYKFKADYLIKNKNRIVGSISLNDLMRINPMPKELDEMYSIGILAEDSLKYYERLKMCKNDIDSSVSNSKFKYFGEFSELIYAFRYCNVDSNKYTLMDIYKNIGGNIYYSESNIIRLKEFIIGSGFDENDSVWIFNIIEFLKMHTFETKLGKYIECLKYFDCIKPKVKEYILSIYKGPVITKRYDKLSDSDLKIINDKLPDIFDTIKLLDEKSVYWSQYLNIIPSRRYSGSEYGTNRREVKNFMKSINSNSEIISPEELYNYFYDKLKDDNWVMPWGGNDEFRLCLVYMIFALVKTNNIAKISEIKVKWNTDTVNYLNSCIFGMQKYNGGDVIAPDYRLNKSEKKKLSEYLISNIRGEIVNSVSNTLNDLQMIQLECFSLAYYLYDLGFNIYCRFVGNSKSILEQTWKVVDGKNCVERTSIKIDFFKTILEYLIENKKESDIMDIIDIIMSYDMSKAEVKKTMDDLGYMFLSYNRDSFKSDIGRKIFTKYFDLKSMNKYIKKDSYY